MIVQTVHMGIELDNKIDELMENIVVNTSAAKEHVTEIERPIRTSKERTRYIVTTTPFN